METDRPALALLRDHPGAIQIMLDVEIDERLLSHQGFRVVPVKPGLLPALSLAIMDLRGRNITVAAEKLGEMLAQARQSEAAKH
jgi:hypothetical protein